MKDPLSWSVKFRFQESLLCGLVCLAGLTGLLLAGPTAALAQTPLQPTTARETGGVSQGTREYTTADYNRRLAQLSQALTQPLLSQENEYRIGPDDLLDIDVFDAPELNRKLRVSGSGDISLPLIGVVQAAGTTAGELEKLLEARLRVYLKDPHVGVFVSAVESHPISVVGAVRKPGVFQVRGPKTVLEMLSMAEGLAEDAGNSVLVMPGAGLQTPRSAAEDVHGEGITPNAAPEDAEGAASLSSGEGGARTIRISVKRLLESEEASANIVVYPGDIVKVTRAGIVYVVGEVKKPGGFVLKDDEGMSVLKAVALAEGLTPTSKKGSARIIRGAPGPGQPREIPINLGKILEGKAPDPTLSAADIVFVPNNGGKAAAYKGSEAAISALTSLLIFRW